MPDIAINIREKIAQLQGSPQIVCGNSDYAVTFDFDAEWNDYDRKTMHIVWLDLRSGELRHDNVQFSGATAMLPALYHCDRVCVGVYAGDIRTTTPACVPCARCITDGEPYHDDPPPDVYEQLLAYMEEIIEGGGGGGGSTPNGSLIGIIPGAVGGTAGAVRLPNRPYIQSNGSQGILCGFTPSTTNVRYELAFADFIPPTVDMWCNIFGGYSDGKRPGGLGLGYNTISGGLVVPIGDATKFDNYGIPYTGYHEHIQIISGNTVTATFDNQYSFSATWSGSLDCPVGLCCSGGANNSIFDKSAVKIFRFKIYENDVLKRDFVPALGENDRPAFYDNVSQTYFYSVTGTDFVYVPAETEG